MRIATWNVNSVRARRDRLLGWLEARGPDVVCLQETKVTDEEFPFAELADVGYRALTRGQRGYNGVAILSRDEGLSPERGFGDDLADEEARLVAAEVGGVRVASVYVPNGQSPGSDKYQFKIEWMGRLREWVGRALATGTPLVVGGDFNVAPDDRDVYDPPRWEGSIMCTEPERAALRGIAGKGLTDAFRLHHADAGAFTWWDYRLRSFERNRGLRIDHIYLSDSLVPRCTAAEVDRDARAGKNASDHAPLIVTLD
jgi:exodeoxyribonuclease III